MPENPHAGEGMVVLDIGGDVGALLVSAPAELADAEIEICPSGRRGGPPDDGADWWIGEWHSHSHDEHHAHSHAAAWPHVSILTRAVTGGASAIFPGLRAGRYDLWLRPDEPTALTVEVAGGQVTSADWPASTS